MSMTPVTYQHKDSIAERFNDLDLANNYTIVVSARKGLATRLFYDFAKAIKMPEKKLAGILNISARTINNYTEAHKNLEPPYGEHLLRLISLFEKGEEIFGSIDEFNYWLQKPFWNSQEKPMDWLSTGGGVDFVSEELDKLAQGYPV